jgi:hypothetical protein
LKKNQKRTKKNVECHHIFPILVDKKTAQNGTLFRKIAYLCGDMLRKAYKNSPEPSDKECQEGTHYILPRDSFIHFNKESSITKYK